MSNSRLLLCSVIAEVLGVNEIVPKDNSRKTIIH